MFPQSFAMFLYLRQQGYTGQFNNMIYDWCLNEGAPKGQLNEMVNHTLGLLGYTGALSERTAAFMTALTTGMTIEQLITKYSPLLITDETGALQNTGALVKSNEGDPVGMLIDQSQGTKVETIYGENIFVAAPSLSTGWTYSDGLFHAVDGANFCRAFNSLVVDGLHEVEIVVSNYTSGSLGMRMGNTGNTTLSASSNGTYIIEGPEASNASLYLMGDNGFNGSVEVRSVREYEIEIEGLGPELVTNGDFATGDLTGFTLEEAGADVAVVSNVAVTTVTVAAPNRGFVTTALTTTSGEWYLLAVDAGECDPVDVILRIGEAPSENQSGTFNVPADRKSSVMFKATSATTYVTIRPSSVVEGEVSRVNSVSVKSAAGNHLVAPSDAQRPTSVAGDMAFDGVDDAMSFTYAGGEIFMRVNSTDTYFATLSGGSDAFDGNYLGLARATVNPSASYDTPTYVDGVLIGTTQQDYLDALADGETHTVNFRYNASSSWVVAWLGGVTSRHMTGTIGSRMYAHDNSGPYGPLTDAERAVITKWIKA